VAQRFTPAIKDLFSMTAPAADGNCRALHEFFSNLFSRAICAAQQPCSSIKLCGGHEFCACHDSVEKCPRFNAYGTLFVERRVRLVSIIVKIVA
jgi:hypothetical protein